MEYAGMVLISGIIWAGFGIAILQRRYESREGHQIYHNTPIKDFLAFLFKHILYGPFAFKARGE